MKKGIKSVFVVGLLLIASIFVVNAHYGNDNQPQGTYHDDMVEIVESGTYEDLEAFRAENGGFGGPRWVTDQESFESWQERHGSMEGYMQGYGQRGGRGAGCPMMGGY